MICTTYQTLFGRIRWAAHVARMAEDTNADSFVGDTYNKRDYFKAGRILKWVLKEYNVVAFIAFI